MTHDTGQGFWVLCPCDITCSWCGVHKESVSIQLEGSSLIWSSWSCRGWLPIVSLLPDAQISFGIELWLPMWYRGVRKCQKVESEVPIHKRVRESRRSPDLVCLPRTPTIYGYCRVNHHEAPLGENAVNAQFGDLSGTRAMKLRLWCPSATENLCNRFEV